MIWEDIRREVEELVDLARKIERWDYTAKYLKAPPSDEALRERRRWEERFTDLQAKYTVRER